MSSPASYPTKSLDFHTVTVGPAVKPQLPKLTLPKFRGVTTTWSSFWDSFKAALHMIMTVFQKLTSLTTYLRI